MLTALLVVAAALYFQGYWGPKEVPEEVEPYVPPEPHVVIKRESAPSTPAPLEPGPRLPERPQPGAAPGRDDLPQRAIDSFTSGNYETAVALFSELSRRDEGAFLGLGLSYYKLGDYRSSAFFLEKALGHEGVDEFEVTKFLAFTYYKLDNLDQSLANAQAALRMKSDPDLRALVERLEREKPAQESFLKEETLHFKILFDGYEHGAVSSKVLQILEDAYVSIGAQIGHFPRDAVTVIVYPGKEFYDVTRMPDWSGGIFDGKIRLPLKGIDDYDPEVLKKVLYHEYTHALVYSITPNCPTWVNEGLAMYFSGERREKVGQLISLRSLEKQFPRSHDLSTTAYSVSYSAVTHLIENYGLYSIRDFLFALSRGESVEGAFNSAFFVSYNDFVSSWGRS